MFGFIAPDLNARGIQSSFVGVIGIFVLSSSVGGLMMWFSSKLWVPDYAPIVVGAVSVFVLFFLLFYCMGGESFIFYQVMGIYTAAVFLARVGFTEGDWAIQFGSVAGAFLCFLIILSMYSRWLVARFPGMQSRP